MEGDAGRRLALTVDVEGPIAALRRRVEVQAGRTGDLLAVVAELAAVGRVRQRHGPAQRPTTPRRRRGRRRRGRRRRRRRRFRARVHGVETAHVRKGEVLTLTHHHQRICKYKKKPTISKDLDETLWTASLTVRMNESVRTEFFFIEY